jgi:hypothetical protein
MEFYGTEDNPLRQGLLKLLNNRSFSRQLGTSSGGHLGIFPITSRTGDDIWAIAGVSMPLVLRRGGHEAWSLVGEAYVHGIMHGEVVSTMTAQEDVIIS